ncbi:MAG: hypothetical protein AAF821_02105 [Cyanobacteria bacterium P01_D01_bin.156]
MNSSIKKVLSYVGFSLCLISTVFVFRYIQEYAVNIDYKQFQVSEIALGILLVFVFGTFNFLLAISWRRILRFLGVYINQDDASEIYGLSQLVKYVPGNILHLTGRQALGMSMGLPGFRVAKSIVWELGLLACSGTFFILLVLPLRLETISVFWATVSFVAVLVIATALVKKLFGTALMHALLLQILFLTLTGVNFVVVLRTLSSPVIPISNIQLIAAYIVAWLIGLVTPGAPAGAGIRELVLMFLLGAYFSEPQLLASVLITRFITVGGDFIFFLIAISKKKYNWRFSKEKSEQRCSENQVIEKKTMVR